MSQASFYDDLAEYYDLVYEDWELSMQRQGTAIAGILSLIAPHNRVLDVSAGIGTQALPLAGHGYEVVARDLSSLAIARLGREAASRNLGIDAAPADMRSVGSSVHGLFDAVISLDNSIPHLLNDEAIVETLRGFVQLLAPNGVVLLSVRDYEAVDHTAPSARPYGDRTRAGRRFRLTQHWEWIDPHHYETTMQVEEFRAAGWCEVLRTTAQYYAVPLNHLLTLMGQAGLRGERIEGTQFFQPILRGRAQRPQPEGE